VAQPKVRLMILALSGLISPATDSCLNVGGPHICILVVKKYRCKSWIVSPVIMLQLVYDFAGATLRKWVGRDTYHKTRKGSLKGCHCEILPKRLWVNQCDKEVIDCLEPKKMLVRQSRSWKIPEELGIPTGHKTEAQFRRVRQGVYGPEKA
jgi:hypothetical protein